MPLRLLLVVLLCAACVSAGGTAPVPPPPSTTTTVPMPTPDEAAAGFAACMEAAGVPVPVPPLDQLDHPDLAVAFAGVDPGSDAFRAALAQCGPALVASGALALGDDPELRGEVVSRLQAFAQCMREQGFDFPDPAPDFDGSGPAFPLEAIPFSAPGFDDAAAACQP